MLILEWYVVLYQHSALTSLFVHLFEDDRRAVVQGVPTNVMSSLQNKLVNILSQLETITLEVA